MKKKDFTEILPLIFSNLIIKILTTTLVTFHEVELGIIFLLQIFFLQGPRSRIIIALKLLLGGQKWNLLFYSMVT